MRRTRPPPAPRPCGSAQRRSPSSIQSGPSQESRSPPVAARPRLSPVSRPRRRATRARGASAPAGRDAATAAIWRRRSRAAKGSRTERRTSSVAAARASTPSAPGRRARAPRGLAAKRSSSPSPFDLQEPDERLQPLALRREHDVRNAERPKLGCDLVAILGGERVEPLAELAAPRVDRQLASGLGVDEPQLAEVG